MKHICYLDLMLLELLVETDEIIRLTATHLETLKQSIILNVSNWITEKDFCRKNISSLKWRLIEKGLFETQF